MANGIKNIETDIARKIGKVALLTQAEVKKNTPVITGRLRNSIVAVNRGSAEWVVGTNLKYAQYVELGVKPFTITPKNKQALYWQGAEHPVKKVNHPGFDGKNMFLKGSNFAKKKLREEFSK